MRTRAYIRRYKKQWRRRQRQIEGRSEKGRWQKITARYLPLMPRHKFDWVTYFHKGASAKRLGF